MTQQIREKSSPRVWIHSSARRDEKNRRFVSLPKGEL